MKTQETLQALLDGKKVRQVTWKPGDYIFPWVSEEKTTALIYAPSAGLMYFNNEEGSFGLLKEEDASAVFSVDIEWELYEDVVKADSSEEGESQLN